MALLFRGDARVAALGARPRSPGRAGRRCGACGGRRELPKDYLSASRAPSVQETAALFLARRCAPEAGDIALMNLDRGALRGGELAGPIAGRNGVDGDSPAFDVKSNPPIFHGEEHSVLERADAAVRVGLGAEGEGALDGRQEVDGVGSAEPLGLLGGGGAPFDLEAGLGVGGRGDGAARVRGGREGLEPAGAGARVGVGVGDVGLDIEDGRAVDEVEVADVEGEPVDAVEADGAEAEGVWAVGRSGGEDTAAFAGAPRREDLGSPALVQVEPEEDPDSVKPFEVFEGVLEAVPWDELDGARDVAGGEGLAGRAHAVGEGGAGDADGGDGEARREARGARRARGHGGTARVARGRVAAGMLRAAGVGVGLDRGGATWKVAGASPP